MEEVVGDGADGIRFDVELARDEIAQLLVEESPVEVVMGLDRDGGLLEVCVTVARD